MPKVLNVRDLPGFERRVPILPKDAVYIGREAGRYRLRRSIWANMKLPPNATHDQRNRSVDGYETHLRCDPVMMAQLSELGGRDLVCWCAPERCHGDVLLKLANAAP
jgi:hypothetical protein